MSPPMTARAPEQDDRLGQHHLPLLRRPGQARDGHHAPVGGSSWYFLRYMDPPQRQGTGQQGGVGLLVPVDWYNGGMEHTTLHLLYSRFWHKFLYDIGVVPTKEPYAKRTSHGMILGEGGEKMSKSRGNVVNPNDIVAQYGADTMRLHIMFIGDFERPSAGATRLSRAASASWTAASICRNTPQVRSISPRTRAHPPKPSRRFARISTS